MIGNRRLVFPVYFIVFFCFSSLRWQRRREKCEGITESWYSIFIIIFLLQSSSLEKTTRDLRVYIGISSESETMKSSSEEFWPEDVKHSNSEDGISSEDPSSHLDSNSINADTGRFGMVRPETTYVLERRPDAVPRVGER